MNNSNSVPIEHSDSSLSNDFEPGPLREASKRRTPPDRGIVLLDAKGRIAPKIWALHGKVDIPVILKDDKYLDNRFNSFYRDAQGHAFLLVPWISQSNPRRYELADSAYRRAVGLGVTESAMLFFTCVYQFEIPDYACIAIHSSKGDDVLSEDKCHVLFKFEQARLAESLRQVNFEVIPGKKVKPVVIHAADKASPNLYFAANMLVLHHQYNALKLQQLWENSAHII